MKNFLQFIIAILVATTASFSQIPTDSLVAYYPFNGNTNDESGNGYNGINYGANLTTDRFGQSNKAYSFDGINDYIEFSNTEDLNFISGGFSLCVWLNYSLVEEMTILAKHI